MNRLSATSTADILEHCLDNNSCYMDNEGNLIKEILDMQTDYICFFNFSLRLCFMNSSFTDFFNVANHLEQSSFLDFFPENEQAKVAEKIEQLEYSAGTIEFVSNATVQSAEHKLWWTCNRLSENIIQASARNISALLQHSFSPDIFMSTLESNHINKNIKLGTDLSNDVSEIYTILSKFPFMIWALDKDLNFVFWNKECEILSGYPQDEIVSNKNIFSLLFPDEQIRKKRTNNIRESNCSGVWEAGISRKDGSVLWISAINVSSLINIEGWEYVFVGTDKTSRWQTQQALKDSEKRYRTLFSSIQAGLLLFRENINSDGTVNDYLLFDANPSAEQTLHINRNSMQNMSVYDLFPQLASEWDNACSQIRETEDPVHIHYEVKDTQEYYDISVFCPASGEVGALFTDISYIIATRDELRTQLNFMQTLIDTIPTPIFFKDLQGRFFNCNRAFEIYAGLDKQDIIGNTIDILHETLSFSDMEYIDQIEQELLATPGHMHHEYGIKKEDGRLRHLIANRATFCGNNGATAGIVAVLTDITEKRNVEKKLEKQLHFQQFLMDIIPAPIFFLNPQGKYFKCNRAFEEYTGKNRKQIIGASASEIPECFALWKYYLFGYVYDNSIIKTTNGTQIKKFFHADGTIRDVIINSDVYSNTDNDPAGLVGVIMDVTAQMEAERKLTEQVNFLATLIETIPNPVFYRGLDGILLECNRAYADFVGLAKEELIGNNLFNLFKKEYAEIFCRTDHELINSGTGKIIYENEMETPTGKKYDLLVHKTILRNNKGEPFAVLGALTDLTDHRALEQTMARMDQYRIIGEMAAAIGHEVRNPMTTVRGFLQLLLETKQTYNHEDYFNLMIEEIDRANSILTDFLALGKDHHLELEKTNLNEVVRASYLILSVEAKKLDHELDIIVNNNIPVIMLDFKQIRQLIFNLVRNGFEAMKQPGTVTIQTDYYNGNVVLSVNDQGNGIDSSVMEKLGKPFVTTKEKGTGLGLAVCYSIVERHAARLEVNTSEKGTTFNIYFPYH